MRRDGKERDFEDRWFDGRGRGEREMHFGRGGKLGLLLGWR